MLLSAGTVSSPHHPGLQPWVWFEIVPAFADVLRILPVQSEDGLQAAAKNCQLSLQHLFTSAQREAFDLLRKHK